jgi:hypothetical protein
MTSITRRQLVPTVVKNFFSGLFEGIQDAKNYKAKGFAEYYLSKSVDHRDLELRQKELVKRGIL